MCRFFCYHLKKNKKTIDIDTDNHYHLLIERSYSLFPNPSIRSRSEKAWRYPRQVFFMLFAHKKARFFIHVTMTVQKVKKSFLKCMTFKKSFKLSENKVFPFFSFLKIQRENAIRPYFMV
ncbi:hypothetical protein AXI59_02570 [Bacillus nakamurai]|uniref:Uncharacterized protein n=1 Tax=Bacillus nakamurai TaxID=1793963 RepID=A0A150F6H0_9BACI|nr:hypothetical protein AXI59_02570 [Bacillus nakamurai]KXZ18001.1 hypothetical protein AXI58_17615 [Bacillus nakamurai]